MKKVIVAIAVVLSVGFTITSCKSEQKDAKEVEKEVVEEVKEVEVKEVKTEIMALAVYQCPMDCEEGKTYNKPGECPVCKMDLKKKESIGDTDAHKEGDGHNHETKSEEQEG